MPRASERNPDRDPLNKFRVPLKTWGAWTLVAKHVFNKTYETAMKSSDVIDAYPKSDRVTIPDKQWKTIAWNAAFLAASVTSRGERHLIQDLSERIRG